jgi:hypothetical protein
MVAPAGGQSGSQSAEAARCISRRSSRWPIAPSWGLAMWVQGQLREITIDRGHLELCAGHGEQGRVYLSPPR